jgi:hypothetical protein
MARQAELVPGRHRRPDDPPAPAAGDVGATTVVGQSGSHSIYVSQPRATADLIKQAASAPS